MENSDKHYSEQTGSVLKLRLLKYNPRNIKIAIPTRIRRVLVGARTTAISTRNGKLGIGGPGNEHYGLIRTWAVMSADVNIKAAN